MLGAVPTTRELLRDLLAGLRAVRATPLALL
jgi:hypothetical protein